MRVIVFSDSHKCYRSVEKIVQNNIQEKIFIFCGDGESDIELLCENYPDKVFLSVKGNTDSNRRLPEFGVFEIGGHRIFYTHGDRLYAGITNELIIEQAKLNACDIALFGHTHQRYQRFEGGVYLFNPGSCACPRDGKEPCYGYIDIEKTGLFFAHVKL